MQWETNKKLLNKNETSPRMEESVWKESGTFFILISGEDPLPASIPAGKYFPNLFSAFLPAYKIRSDYPLEMNISCKNNFFTLYPSE